MPEMQAIWQAIISETITVTKSNESSSIQLPVQNVRQQQTIAVYVDDRSKISPANNSLTAIRYPVFISSAKVVRRPTRSVKRYLVFCQMKLEG